MGERKSDGQPGGKQPPRGPVDTSKEANDDGAMEPRILKLEKFAEECRQELRSIDVRLTRLETLAEATARTMATKADLAQLETRLIKWFIGTATALAGLAFAAGKFLH